MNILIISNMFPNDFQPTSGIFVREQCKALMRRGINLTVISPTPLVFPGLQLFSKKWLNYSKIPLSEFVDGISVIRPKFIAIPSGIFKQYWYLFLYLFSKSKIKKLHRENKYDLIHVHGSAPDDYTGYLLSKKLKIPFMITVHGESVEDLARRGSRFKTSKIAIEKAHAIIAVSSKIVNRIEEVTLRKRDIFLISNGYVPSDIKVIKEAKGTFDILFAGTLTPRKGASYLIKAFAELVNDKERLHIVGEGEEMNKLINLVNHLEINNKVKFYGFLDHTKLMKKMSECDVFIMPSWKEAFGVVYIEAMSFKKPVIGTVGEGIEDVIKNGDNGLLVEPQNVKSIVEKIQLLRDDEDLRNKIALRGYETSKNLTWENNAIKNIRIYKKLLVNERIQ